MLFLLTISTRSLPFGFDRYRCSSCERAAKTGDCSSRTDLHSLSTRGGRSRRLGTAGSRSVYFICRITCFVLRESSSHFDSPPLASLIQGEVTQTYSAVRVGDALALWRFVLAVAMEESYSLTFNEIAQLADLEQSAPEPSQQRLYSRPNSEETKLRADLAPPHFGDVVWAEHYSDAIPPILRARDLHTFDALHPVALAKVSLFYLLLHLKSHFVCK